MILLFFATSELPRQSSGKKHVKRGRYYLDDVDLDQQSVQCAFRATGSTNKGSVYRGLILEVLFDNDSNTIYALFVGISTFPLSQ